ncbi:MAG: PH domain-containing protein [Planctomycetales bacterium]|nr:PH domain-containing protein [Planctomycetales bacterium]
MKQAIAGTNPAVTKEATVMTVWPSVAKYGIARALGQLYAIDAGVWVITFGNIVALLSAPLAAVLYLLRVAPFVGCRYTLTNRRVVVQQGIVGRVEAKSIQLDRFDAIEIVVRAGQAWYSAGDLVFRHQGTETFRLDGVSRPESFRQACLKSHRAYVGVQKEFA